MMIVIFSYTITFSRTSGEVVAGVVAKCLNSSRTKTKQKGIDILMIYIELEKQESVMVSYAVF